MFKEHFNAVRDCALVKVTKKAMVNVKTTMRGNLQVDIYERD